MENTEPPREREPSRAAPGTFLPMNDIGETDVAWELKVRSRRNRQTATSEDANSAQEPELKDVPSRTAPTYDTGHEPSATGGYR
jgi:hypothetical protein